MVELKNPLDVLERNELFRLIGHDLNHFRQLKSGEFIGDPNLKIVGAIDDYEESVLRTMDLLGLKDYFNLDPRQIEKKAGILDLEAMIEGFRILLHNPNINAEFDSIDGFLTLNPILATILFNLIRNSYSSHRNSTGANGNSPIILSAKYGIPPEDTIYVPSGSEKYKKFVSLQVRDVGDGFKKDKPLESYFPKKKPKGRRLLTMNTERKKSCFGLKFVGLAAKVLRSPVHIESQEGDTRVTIYHPIYNSN